MAKRFTATDKWDKVWFRKLAPEYKCLWDFMLSKCDIAGVWEIDFESANHYIGKNVDQAKALQLFKEQIIVLDSKKWFIVDFVTFQYGNKPLNPHSPIHIKIIEILRKYTLWDSVGGRVLCSTKEKEEEEDKEVDMVEETEVDKEDVKVLKVGCVYNTFYDSEIVKSNNDENYVKFVKVVFGENPLQKPLSAILKMPEQLSFAQFGYLWDIKNKTGCLITDVLLKMENWKDLSKRKTLLETFRTFATPKEK